MRPIHFVSASALTLAALLGAVSSADAQSRTLSWPGKTAPAAPAASAEFAPDLGRAAVPAPFVASSVAPARINNRYSPRSGAARLAAHTPVRPGPVFEARRVSPPIYTPPVYTAPVYAPPVYAPPPAYTPPVYVPPAAAMPAPASEYGPPVIPNMVKPAPVASAPTARVIVEIAPPAPQVAARPVSSKPAPVKTAPEAAPVQAAVAPPSVDRPFVRPASSNGPRFYSVHREYGGAPDATFRSKPQGAPATERLPAGFFASGETAVEEEEPQDDAETRAAALRAAEKATKAKGKKR